MFFLGRISLGRHLILKFFILLLFLSCLGVLIVFSCFLTMKLKILIGTFLLTSLLIHLLRFYVPKFDWSSVIGKTDFIVFLGMSFLVWGLLVYSVSLEEVVCVISVVIPIYFQILLYSLALDFNKKRFRILGVLKDIVRLIQDLKVYQLRTLMGRDVHLEIDFSNYASLSAEVNGVLRNKLLGLLRDWEKINSLSQEVKCERGTQTQDKVYLEIVSILEKELYRIAFDVSVSS